MQVKICRSDSERFVLVVQRSESVGNEVVVGGRGSDVRLEEMRGIGDRVL